jgi:hypothetical protein
MSYFDYIRNRTLLRAHIHYCILGKSIHSSRQTVGEALLGSQAMDRLLCLQSYIDYITNHECENDSGRVLTYDRSHSLLWQVGREKGHFCEE